MKYINPSFRQTHTERRFPGDVKVDQGIKPEAKILPDILTGLSKECFRFLYEHRCNFSHE